MDFNDLKNRSDADVLRMFLGATMMQLSSGSDKDPERVALMQRMEPILKTCIDNMTKVESLTRDLINTKEDLAIEKMSSRRKSKVIRLVADLLAGDPYCYPVEIQNVALAVHKENGTLDSLLRGHGRKVGG